MERPELAIVIPAFNEQATIGRVVEQVSRYGLAIVIDDASTDATAERAASAGALVLSQIVNQGYDGALNRGFAKAAEIGAEYVITFDADGQHDAALLGRFVEALRGGAAVVLGIRPATARLAESIFARYAKLRFGIDDPLCGMKGYRMLAYRSVGHFDTYQSIGTELALRIVANGARFVQMPITVGKRFGTPRFGTSFRANIRIARAMLLSARIQKKRFAPICY